MQYEANPFTEELEAGVEAASVAYKYRLFSLGSIRLVARREVHCWTNKRGETTVSCVGRVVLMCVQSVAVCVCTDYLIVS